MSLLTSRAKSEDPPETRQPDFSHVGLARAIGVRRLRLPGARLLPSSSFPDPNLFCGAPTSRLTPEWNESTETGGRPLLMHWHKAGLLRPDQLSSRPGGSWLGLPLTPARGRCQASSRFYVMRCTVPPARTTDPPPARGRWLWMAEATADAASCPPLHVRRGYLLLLCARGRGGLPTFRSGTHRGRSTFFAGASQATVGHRP